MLLVISAKERGPIADRSIPSPGSGRRRLRYCLPPQRWCRIRHIRRSSPWGQWLCHCCCMISNASRSTGLKHFRPSSALIRWRPGDVGDHPVHVRRLAAVGAETEAHPGMIYSTPTIKYPLSLAGNGVDADERNGRFEIPGGFNGESCHVDRELSGLDDGLFL